MRHGSPHWSSPRARCGAGSPSPRRARRRPRQDRDRCPLRGVTRDPPPSARWRNAGTAVGFREDRDGPTGLVQGAVGGSGQFPHVQRGRTGSPEAPGLAGDEGQLVRQAVVQIAGDPSSLLGRRPLLELLVGGPVGQGELEEVTQGDAAVDAFGGERCAAAGSESTPCSSPSGQTGTQAPCVMPVAVMTARKTGPTLRGRGRRRRAAGSPRRPAIPGCSSSGQLPRGSGGPKCRTVRRSTTMPPSIRMYGRPPDLGSRRQSDARRPAGCQARRSPAAPTTASARAPPCSIASSWLKQPRRALVGFDEPVCAAHGCRW